MTTKGISIHTPLLSWWLLVSITGAVFLSPTFAQTQNKTSTISARAMQGVPAFVTGAWSGTLFPKHSNVPPFTITVVIGPDVHGNLVGISTLSSDCLRAVDLEVTVTGSRVVLAGSDETGNNITVRGTLDKTGALLKVSYVLNGSATGRCESEIGIGSLAKR